MEQAFMEKNQEQEKIDYPWVVFKLNHKLYAFNSEYISGIVELPGNVEAVPDSNPYIRGITNLRGDVIPLMELRMFFGMATMKEEFDSFKEMLDHRIADHRHWVEELNRCAETGEKFTLATNPHQCALGQWYDHFTTDVHSVSHHLRRLEEPHSRLHNAAVELEGCSQECASCERQECLKDVMARVEDEYVPRIVQLLEDAKEVFRSSYREMVVLLARGGKSLGVIVDEILSVESLAIGDYDGVQRFHHTDYVTGISQKEGTGEMILILDEDKLLEILENR